MKHILFYTAAFLIICIVVRAQSDKPRSLCDPQCNAIHLDGKPCDTITPRFKIGDRLRGMNMMHITASMTFYITDSTGIVAERDSSGKWKINNPERAIEVCYQIFASQKKDDPEPAGKEEIRYGSIWESNYGDTYIYDARWIRVADRNSSGKWEIIDAAKTLEIIYQVIRKQNKL